MDRVPQAIFGNRKEPRLVPPAWLAVRVNGAHGLESLVYWVAAGLAATTLVSSAIVVVAHLSDRYHVDHVSGIWMGLAQHTNSGTFYPDLYDGSVFGGTRYMPFYFLIEALVARGLGDYVTSGKLVSAVALTCLIGLTFFVIRRFGVPRSFAILLATFVLLTDPGFCALTGIRADALATMFQLGAVALIAHRGPHLAVPAAGLAALAVFTKVSALWAPAAIAVWLYLYDRRRSWLFAASFVGFVLALAVAVQIASDGRFLDNVGHIAFSGIRAESAVQKSTLYTLSLLMVNAPAVWALVPFVIGSWVLAAKRGEITIYHIAWPVSVFILLVVMTDVGTSQNQLIDPIIVSIIVLATLWPAYQADMSSPLGIVLVVAILWAGGTIFALHVRKEAQEIVLPIARGEPYPQPTLNTLLAQLQSGSQVLAEDASISVARGDLPFILDPWAIPRIESRHQEWVAQLARRIEAAEFDYVVLLYRFETVDPTFDGWYANHFGKTVMSAISKRYQWIGDADGFYIYGPR
jgi:hypothetical protein